jgi:uroporphyrinogen III methyltransferase/synthase
VAVTRARAQASELAQRLADLGASVVRAPTIRTRPLAGPPLDPRPYDLICLTSPNGVELLFERLNDGTHPPGDARALAGVRVAAIGPGTARALAEHGIVADVVPERFVAESLVEALSSIDMHRVLVARALEGRDVLPDALRARGAEVDLLTLYETVAEPLSERVLEQARTADYITFTSSSTVHHFLEAARGGGGDAGASPPGTLLSPATRIASIGPVTSATLRERGLEPHVEAHRHDIDGLVEALLADVLAPPR